MNDDIITYLLLFLLIVLVNFVFIWVSVKLRRGGGSMTTIALGATDEFLNKEKRKAAETIVNENAGKKFKTNKKTEEK
jgi:hypothetical protein